jgi:hypothetical protein
MTTATDADTAEVLRAEESFFAAPSNQEPWSSSSDAPG